MSASPHEGGADLDTGLALNGHIDDGKQAGERNRHLRIDGEELANLGGVRATGGIARQQSKLFGVLAQEFADTGHGFYSVHRHLQAVQMLKRFAQTEPLRKPS